MLAKDFSGGGVAWRGAYKCAVTIPYVMALWGYVVCASVGCLPLTSILRGAGMWSGVVRCSFEKFAYHYLVQPVCLSCHDAAKHWSKFALHSSIAM